jgi:hypothetical protein
MAAAALTASRWPSVPAVNVMRKSAFLALGVHTCLNDAASSREQAPSHHEDTREEENRIFLISIYFFDG